jgi:prepilin-type N-terminal cleavage/methylation domain-containing protein
MMKNRRGLTLVEVLMVVMILGVLATIVVPRYWGQQERGNVAEAIEVLSAIRVGEEAHRMEFGVYFAPGNWNTLGIDTPDMTRWNYAVAINAGVSFTATATRTATGQGCANRTITLTNAGVYGGTHPYGPNPAAGATCN